MDWFHAGVWAAVVLVAATLIVRSSGEPEAEPCAKFIVGDITSHSLAHYCGYDVFKPILVAIQGKVYDVTNAADLYGPGTL